MQDMVADRDSVEHNARIVPELLCATRFIDGRYVTTDETQVVRRAPYVLNNNLNFN